MVLQLMDRHRRNNDDGKERRTRPFPCERGKAVFISGEIPTDQIKLIDQSFYPKTKRKI
jgi:hypothetical protein